MMILRSLLIFMIAFALFDNVMSSKILFAVAFAGNSHWLMFKPLINELLDRGHEVTTITNYELKSASKNYREILIRPAWDWNAIFNMTIPFEVGGTYESPFFKIKSLWDYGIATTKHALDSPNIKDFIENDKTKFDLVISEQFQQEAFNMFAHKYNCPLIVLGSLDYTDFIDRSKGALTPWSHVPHIFSYFSDRMTFFQRVQNTVLSLYDALGRKFYYLPQQTQLAREAFASLENQLNIRLPSVEDLEKRISLHLMNSHPALSYPRPRMPGLIDIAGIQISPPKPLPDDIREFLDGAKDGAIYMSFGSFLKSSEMSPGKFKIITDAFRNIKQRVLWKWESENVPNLPSNVMVKKWLPQSDVLAHKNMKIFIGHGGIYGTQEAIYNAVPLIIFPFFGDQHLNGFKIQDAGLGLLRSMNDLTTEALTTYINEVLSNKTYSENMKQVSEIFRTNQNHPLDTAVWWIEYVIKFKGAKHLQSPAKNLPWYRYLLLDIIIVIFGTIYIIYDLIKQLFNKLDSKSKNEKNKKEPQKQKVKTEIKADESKKSLKRKKKNKEN